jgi:hypothetical protein
MKSNTFEVWMPAFERLQVARFSCQSALSALGLGANSYLIARDIGDEAAIARSLLTLETLKHEWDSAEFEAEVSQKAYDVAVGR